MLILRGGEEQTTCLAPPFRCVLPSLMDTFVSVAKAFGLGSLVLFVVNVIVVALDAPWWLQPFQLLISLGNHVTDAVVWCARHLAAVAVWIASHLKSLLERLGPAIRKSIEDYVAAIMGTLPNWIWEFWATFNETIVAAAALVAPWMSWIVTGTAVTGTLGLLYWLLFVYKPEWGAALLERLLPYSFHLLVSLMAGSVAFFAYKASFAAGAGHTNEAPENRTPPARDGPAAPAARTSTRGRTARQVLLDEAED